MSDKIPKCPKCDSNKNMHQSTYACKGTYVEGWLCFKCDKQDYDFKDLETLNKFDERDE